MAGTRPLSILTLVAIALFASRSAISAKDDNIPQRRKVPPGMELKKVGSANVIVPAGSELRREGDLLIVEGAGEYAARKFEKAEERLADIETDMETMREDITELKKEIAAMKRTRIISK